jgi:hypothetical protein
MTLRSDRLAPYECRMKQRLRCSGSYEAHMAQLSTITEFPSEGALAVT